MPTADSGEVWHPVSMPWENTDPHDLDFESFVEFAHHRSTELADDLDHDAAWLVLALHRASAAVVYDLESTVHRPRGWSWSGFRLLYALWVAGPSETRHAAKVTGMSRQAVSALAATLERDGLLVRTPSPDDGRLVSYSLTDEGTSRVQEAYRAHNQRERLWADVLDPDEREVVVSALRKLLNSSARSEISTRDA